MKYMCVYILRQQEPHVKLFEKCNREESERYRKRSFEGGGRKNEREKERTRNPEVLTPSIVLPRPGLPREQQNSPRISGPALAGSERSAEGQMGERDAPRNPYRDVKRANRISGRCARLRIRRYTRARPSVRVCVSVMRTTGSSLV